MTSTINLLIESKYKMCSVRVRVRVRVRVNLLIESKYKMQGHVTAKSLILR